MDPRNWTDCDTLLQRNGKAVPTRKIANNTYCQRRSGRYQDCFAIKLHDTDIVTFHWDDAITLDSGGWLTDTTRERMNRYLPSPLRIVTFKGRWMTAHNGHNLSMRPFHDGVTVAKDSTGWLIRNPIKGGEVQAQDAHNAMVDNLISDYLETVKNFVTWDKNQAPPGYAGPHAGRCGMCVRTAVGTLAGDEFQDKQHLIDHLIDKMLPYNVWIVSSEQANPQLGRLEIRELAIADLRKYLRNTLYIGAVAIGSGKRPAHTMKPRRLTA